MLPHSNTRPVSNPAHVNHILAAQPLPHIAPNLRARLLLLFLLALQRKETQRFVGANGINVCAGIHETGVCNRRSMVDNLVQSVVLVRLRGIEDVDKTIRAGGEKERGEGWVQGQGCNGVCVGVCVGAEGGGGATLVPVCRVQFWSFFLFV